MSAQGKVGKPKRPLSAYNLFFQLERGKLHKQRDAQIRALISSKANTEAMKNFETMGFVTLVRHIAAKWKSLDADAKAPYQAMARREQERYIKEVVEANGTAQNQSTMKPSSLKGKTMKNVCPRSDTTKPSDFADQIEQEMMKTPPLSLVSALDSCRHRQKVPSSAAVSLGSSSRLEHVPSAASLPKESNYPDPIQSNYIARTTQLNLALDEDEKDFLISNFSPRL